jgi:hypothetical protein
MARSAQPDSPRRSALEYDLRIVSGGQTGADRSALDWARARCVPHGGWCPQGRLAEDGAIASHYPLNETPSPAYLQRTEWNVRDSCGTVVFSVSRTLSGGSLATVMFAQQHQRPCLHLVDEESVEQAAARLRAFIREHRIQVLNVAGSSAAKEPAVGHFVRKTLDEAFIKRGKESMA